MRETLCRKGYKMNISSIVGKDIVKTDYSIARYTSDSVNTAKISSGNQKDILEISEKAYAAQKENTLTATSGKDTLGISKGSKENTYTIHFADSAMVSRAVSRGYITVNGENIELSDDVKKKLLEIDKQAEADRMNAFNTYVMQHELAVAKQQSEAWKKAFEETFEDFELLAQLSGIAPKTNNTNGVDWSQFEWKSYETQMSVSLGKDNKVEEISEGEIVIS